jgi:hypothetical protein
MVVDEWPPSPKLAAGYHEERPVSPLKVRDNVASACVRSDSLRVELGEAMNTSLSQAASRAGSGVAR